MAKKSSVTYVCSNCGAQSSTWSGRCHLCGEWNTLEEQLSVETGQLTASGRALKAEPVSKLAKFESEKRLKTNINEVDSVLGGGFVAGSVVLIAGQPGIGKSTLLLQLADAAASKKPVLYVSGEESGHQVRSEEHTS